MKRTLFGIAGVTALGGAVYCAAYLRVEGASPAAPSAHAPRRMVTAPGTVEPLSEEIEVGSELPGKLERVLVEEGARIRAGQVIAVLTNRDYAAQVASARATLQEREAALRRVVNGARAEERQEARAALEAAEAVLANAISVRDRRRQLLDQGAVSREEADRAEEAYRVAEANKRASAERYALVDGQAREEDHAGASAAVALARASVSQAEAMLAKTYVRSPLSGVVLRKHHHDGETVSNSPADPIVTVGDISRLRVRAEVDELDIASVRPGLRVRVRADAFGDRDFFGTIVTVGQSLGKKAVRTDEPGERVDTKVLEVVVDLDSSDDLRPRLRVDVFIEVGGNDDGAS